MATLRAFTITPQKNNPRVHILKECYIMRHSHISDCVWNTKIKLRLVYLKDTMRSIIEMYEEQLGVPYLANINKGDVVSLVHHRILAAWEVSKKYDINDKEATNEVRRILDKQ